MILWLKAFHVVAVVTWFAGLFYLPRLFVYHAMADDQVSQERFKIMERKLYRGIMTPSAIVVLILGVALIAQYPFSALIHMHWLHVKLVVVLALYGYHGWCGRLVRLFAADANHHGHVWYRWFNEAPVLALIAVVILAVVKPF
jgi:putative membrane protein